MMMAGSLWWSAHATASRYTASSPPSSMAAPCKAPRWQVCSLGALAAQYMAALTYLVDECGHRLPIAGSAADQDRFITSGASRNDSGGVPSTRHGTYNTRVPRRRAQGRQRPAVGERRLRVREQPPLAAVTAAR